MLISRLCRLIRLLPSTQNSLRIQEELGGGVWSEQLEPGHLSSAHCWSPIRGKNIFLNIYLAFWVWPAVHKSHDQLSVKSKIRVKWDWWLQFNIRCFLLNHVDSTADLEDLQIRSDTSVFSLCFRIWSKVADKAGCWCVFLFWMPSSHQCAAFENRHRGAGDESSKVERQRITTHVHAHRYTHTHACTQAGTGKQWTAWLHKHNEDAQGTVSIFCPSIIASLPWSFFYHLPPPPPPPTYTHTCTHPNTLTLCLENCVCIYFLSLPHWVFSSICCLRQWWQIPALLALTTQTAAERVKRHCNKQAPSRK